VTGKYQVNLARKPYPDWPSAQDSFESRWSKFVAVCRLLHRDRLEYQVRLGQREGALWGMITASGTVHHRRQSVPKAAIPDPPDLRACRVHLAEAEITLSREREAVRRHFSRWREDPESSYRAAFQLDARLDLRRKQKTLGKAIGRIIARRQAKWGKVRIDKSSIEPDRQDYAELDAAVGGRVPRLSQLHKYEREHPYLSVIVRRCAAGTFIRPPVEVVTWTQESIWREPLHLPPQYEPGPIRCYQEAKADVEYWREMVNLQS
jgi:hypothetical protein